MNENFFISQKWINAKYIQSHYNLPNGGEYIKGGNGNGNVQSQFNGAKAESFPKSFDWLSKGMITPVLDQGPCGSCWIFAGLTVVESANAIAKNPLVELSKQELMDCVKPPYYESDGCQGGTADDVYSFVQQFGVVTDKVYPYTGRVRFDIL